MDSTTRHILDLSRRGLLRGATGLAALAALAPAPRRALAQAPGGTYLFTLGVASGDPSPDGFVIWTRLAPEPFASDWGMPAGSVPVAWDVAEDPGFTRIAVRGMTAAWPERAHSVHVEVAGLAPGRPYFYRFRAGGEASPVGRARTAPAPGAAPAKLRLRVRLRPTPPPRALAQ